MEVKLEIELPYDPGAPLLGVYPEKKKKLIQRCMHSNSNSSTV